MRSATKLEILLQQRDELIQAWVDRGEDTEVSTRVAAAILGFPEMTLRSWRMRSLGPPSRKYVGSVSYRVSELLAWRDSIPVVGDTNGDSAA